MVQVWHNVFNQAKYLRDLISTTSFLCVFLTYEALSSMQWIILAGEKRKLSEPRWFGNRILMFLVMRALLWIPSWELFMIWETASHISGIATSPSRFKNDFTRFYLNSTVLVVSTERLYFPYRQGLWDTKPRKTEENWRKEAKWNCFQCYHYFSQSAYAYAYQVLCIS